MVRCLTVWLEERKLCSENPYEVVAKILEPIMFRELWRCERTNTVPWALKVRANTVSWALEVRDFTSRHTSLTHLMLVPWASIWLFDDISEAKDESEKWKAKGESEDEGEVNVSRSAVEFELSWEESTQLDQLDELREKEIRRLFKHINMFRCQLIILLTILPIYHSIYSFIDMFSYQFSYLLIY